MPRAADNFYYFAEMCVRVDGHTYPTPTHLNYTLFHPVGVCALISPWNVPFMTATWKVAPCLAFGNTAVLKMSELSPLTAARLGELALEAGMPAGVLNVVHGFGGEAGEPLCAHPDVRAISFTGSTAHRQPHRQSAGLKKFSMELGGKSPFVVFDDADLERALDAALFMIFSNNGERCTAGSRILVAEGDLRRVRARASPSARSDPGRRPARREDDRRPDDQPGPSRPRCAATSSSAASEGATLLCGGLDAPELPARVREGQLRPADGVRRRRQPHAHRAGGDLRPGRLPDPVRRRGRRDRAGATTSPYGLSSYVWTENIGRAHRVAAAIEAGMCFVNSQNVRDLRQPFGGTKASGTGREGGTWSYEVFSSRRTSRLARARTTFRTGARDWRAA